MKTPSVSYGRKVRRSSLSLSCSGLLALLFGALVSNACLPAGEPQSSSQTNWFRHCKADTECGDLQCICGACTTLCSEGTDCRQEGSLCLTLSDERADSFCDGAALTKPVCVQSCEELSCSAGTSCKEGVCQVLPVPDAIVTVDLTERYQTLIGFGASLSYAENLIAGREDREDLFDTLFRELGVDTIRLVNRFEAGREGNLDVTSEIIEAATSRIGRTPTLMMTSGSPPAELKANGAKLCNGEEESCTLNQTDDGSFNYQGFAEFWRASLDAYAAVGVEPDFVSIQNNSNWTPPEGNSGDACRFLPEEGTMLVGQSGSEVEARFPGYVEAARAVLAELEGLANVPGLFGPETTSLNAVPRYEPVFAAGLLSAVAIHLYGAGLNNPRTDEMNAVRALATYYDLPVVQSEAMSQGLETAVLIHHSTVEANAAAYLQNDFIGGADALEPNLNALVLLQDEGFIRQGPFYAMQHFASGTDPGWLRVGASASGGLLASSWISPNESALSLILINPTEAPLRTLVERAELASAYESSEVTQTIFNATLDHAELGALAADGWIEVPAQAIVTIAFEQ